MGYCFVCKAYGDSNGLYRLPKKDGKRKMWLKNLKLGIKNLEVETKKDLRVCFRHFQDGDYRIIGTTRRLKPGMYVRSRQLSSAQGLLYLDGLNSQTYLHQTWADF